MRLRTIKYLIQSILTGIGSVWMLVEIYKNSQIEGVAITFWSVMVTGGLAGVIWFLIDGYFIEGFLKRKIRINSNAIDVQIDILFADIFRQKGWQVIAVNEFFDSAVDDAHVSIRSLHGMMLNKYWSSNTQDWDRQIAAGLASIEPVEKVLSRLNPGKSNKYQIGTTIATVVDDHKFLCVVLANTNIQTLQASACSEKLQKALRCMLTKARQVCSGDDLNIPLIGSGLSKTGIKQNIIIDLILLAIFEESRKEKISGTIRIVLPKNLRNKINLITIEKDWR